MRLDKTSVKILKYIKDNQPFGIDGIKKPDALIKKCISSLIEKKLIKDITVNFYENLTDYTQITVSPYEITADGLAYLELHKKEKWENFHKWANTIIAILALITAIYAAI